MKNEKILEMLNNGEIEELNCITRKKKLGNGLM